MPSFLSTQNSGWTEGSDLQRSTNAGTWQRSTTAGDIVHMLRSPKQRRRPFDSRGHPEELLSPKDATVFGLTGPLNPDPGSRVTKGRYLERRASETPFSDAFTDGASPVARADQTPMSMASPMGGQSMSQSMLGRSPIRGSISPQSTRGNRSMRSSTRRELEAPKQEDRALDFWPLGEGMRIANHIAPTKSRNIALSGEIYQGKVRSDWNDIRHIHAIRSRYPTGLQTLQAGCGPFPQGMSQEELRRNRNYDRSHGSVQCTSGMMRVGSQVMFL